MEYLKDLTEAHCYFFDLHQWLESLLIFTIFIICRWCQNLQNYKISNGLQRDLDALNQSASDSWLPLNISKCSIISFSLSREYQQFDTYIKRLSEVKDLGIMLDQKLTFQSHLDHITSKSLRLIKRTWANLTNGKTVISLYKSLVLHNLIHCCHEFETSWVTGNKLFGEHLAQNPNFRVVQNRSNHGEVWSRLLTNSSTQSSQSFTTNR